MNGASSRSHWPREWTLATAAVDPRQPGRRYTLATAITADRRSSLDVDRPWSSALPWVVILGLFFFLTYGFANWMASRRSYVPSVEFGWEHAVPFLAWTIVPYWTSDLLYCVSILVCSTRRELNMHVKRLVAAQVISIACFLAFP